MKIHRSTMMTILFIVGLSSLASFASLEGQLFAANKPSLNKSQSSFTGKNVFSKKRESSHYLPDKLIVKLKENVSLAKGAKSFGISGLDRIIQRYSVVKTEQMFPISAVSSKEHPTDLSRVYVIQYTSAIDAFDAAKEVAQNPEVEYAEPWFIYPVDAIMTCTPNDTLKSKQWALAKIQADSAWCYTTGSDTIVIGIDDTGVKWDHPDLIGNIWINPGEDGLDGSSNNKRTNGIDDDHNGKIDDWHGWDFGGTDYVNPVEDNNPYANSANISHGTHVSGIASASTNNVTGVAGIGYHCKLVPLKVASDNDTRSSGLAYIVFGFQGIEYAADNAIDVVNCSWGGGGASQFEQEVIDYAFERGTIVVAAGGNTGAEEPQYPAAYSGVFSVGATTSGDFKAGYSTYGYSIDCAAPGGDGTAVTTSILSTYISDSYALSYGTSMASPLVAGLVALVKSKFTGYTSIQAAEQVRVSGDDLYSRIPSYRYKLGKGRVNALKAMVTSSPSVRILAYGLDDTQAGNGNGIAEPGETINVTASFINYLQATTPSATVSLVSMSTPYVTIQSGYSSFTIGELSTFATTNNYSSPFKIVIANNAASNFTAKIRFDISDGTYTDYQVLEILVNPTFTTHDVNNVVFSTSNFGSLGYFDYTTTNGTSYGEGFQYPAATATALFHGTLMVGTDSLHVSDNAFGNLSSATVVDFKTAYDGKFSFLNEGGADQVFRCAFTDSGVSPISNALGIKVVQRSYAFTPAPDNDYIMLRYDVWNTTPNTLSNVYVGIYTDWDVDGATTDKVSYDASRRLGYMYDSLGSNYYGVSLLTPQTANSFRAIDNATYIFDGFSEGNKYKFMSSGFNVTQGTPANDWSCLISAGPFTIPSGSYQMVGFAFLGGDSLADLKANADAAQAKSLNVLDVTDDKQVPNTFSLSQNYPNPFNPVTEIQYSIPSKQFVSLKIYDMLGKEVKTLVENEQTAGTHSVKLDASHLASGVYYYRLVSDNYLETKKLMLIK